MANCPICEKLLTCPDSGDQQHKQAVGSAVQDCPLTKGAVWVQVLDEKGSGVLKAAISVAGKTVETDGDGFACFDPLEAGSYDVELSATLPDSHKDTHLTPKTVKINATVKTGEINLVKFRLKLINVVTPKIEEEYRVVLLDRGLAVHQSGEPEGDKIYAEPTRIEISVAETNRKQHPFKTTAKIKCVPENAEIFLDEACKTKLTEDLKAEEIADGKKLNLWLRGKTAGKFEVNVELTDTGDPLVKPAKAPAKLVMGVVELKMEVHQQNIAAVEALEIDPDQDPISNYHTALKDMAMPPQKPMTDAEKIKAGRVLHEQKDGNHGRAKLLIKQLTSDHWPDGTDDYKIVLNQSKKSGELEIFDAEFGGASQGSELDTLKVSTLNTADKELWVEGKMASKLRDLRLDLKLDRAESGLDKKPKHSGDAARFTVVKIDEVKLEYSAPTNKPDAWDSANSRFNINLQTGTEGRKVKISAKLKEKIEHVPIHFMLAPDKANTKTANWGIDLPGTWKWKDIAAAVKHLDKADRKDLLHLSAMTNSDGYAEVELNLSQFGGDVFHPAAYIDQDPHLAKYVDGHVELDKKKPVFSNKTITVWRKFWYQTVKVEGVNSPALDKAVGQYERVKVLMDKAPDLNVAKTDIPTGTPAIYPRYMIVPNGGEADALVLSDQNFQSFFSNYASVPERPLEMPILIGDAMLRHKLRNQNLARTDPKNVTIAKNNFPASLGLTCAAHPGTFYIVKPTVSGDNLVTAGNWKVYELEPDGTKNFEETGSFVDADVDISATRDSVSKIELKFPNGVSARPWDAAKTRVEVTGLVIRGARSILGMSTKVNGNSVNVAVYDPSEADDFHNTIVHELAHTFKQVPRGDPANGIAGVPAHPDQADEGYGNHCRVGGNKCVMYDSGPISGSFNRFCDTCHPYMLVQDMTAMG